MPNEPDEAINPFAARASSPAVDAPAHGLSVEQQITIICYMPVFVLAASFVALLLCGTLGWHKLSHILIGVHAGASVLWVLQLRTARLFCVRRERRGTGS